MTRLKLITSENDVKKLVKQMFDKLNAWSFAPIQNGMGAHGIPDRIACVPVVITKDMVGRTIGVFAAVEAKKPGRRGEENGGATGLQVHQLREIIAAGGYALLADCENDIVSLRYTLTHHEDSYEPLFTSWLKRRTGISG